VLLPPYFIVHFPEWGRGLKQQLLRNSFDPPRYFLCNEISTKGWFTYFPIAFAMKTPPGTLALIAISLASYWRGAPIGRREWLWLVGPAVLFFLAMAVSRVNIGLRVILPVYPFLFVLMGRVATLGSAQNASNDSLRSGRPWARVFALTLCACMLFATGRSSLRMTPFQLSYFNVFAGGADNGHELLGDSNLDWGQGLFALSDYLRARGSPVIYLSYAGTAPPAAYGVRYQLLPGWGHLEPPPAEIVPADATPKLLAISVSNLQGTYLDDPLLYSFLKDQRRPVTTLDHSIWVYDLTSDRDALERIAEIIARQRQVNSHP
jgi:hypothetical protein